MRRIDGLIFGLLAAFFLSASVPEARIFWTVMTPMPTARSHYGLAMTGGQIYCYGGSQNWTSNYMTRVHERYSPATNSWTTLAPMLYPRKAFASGAVGGYLYASGGIDSSLLSTPPSNRHERYDPGSNIWVSLAPLPKPVYGCVGVGYGSYFYVVGGKYGGVGTGYNESSLQRYDPASNTWTQMAIMPESLRYCGATAYAGRIYVMGGTDRNELRSNRVYEYNIATNSWTLLAANMITGRSTVWPDSAASSGRSFIFTAGGAGSGTPQELAVAELFNTPPTSTWFSETPMNYARFAMALARVDSFVYVIGGTTGAGDIPLNYNERGLYVTVNVLVDPDYSDSTDPGVSKYYRLQATNNGWRTDTIDMSTSGTLPGWTVGLYRQDSVTPLPDTDGDGRPDTGPLARGASAFVVVRITPPANALAGQTDVTTARGTSSVDVNVWDNATLTTRVKLVASILVDPDQADSLWPGDSIRYPLTVVNNGNIADTVSLTAVRTRPGWTARLCDSSGVTITRVAAGASGGRRGIFCWIKSPITAPGGAVDTTAVRGTSYFRPAVRDSAVLRTRVRVLASILVDPDQQNSIASGDSVRYPISVINNGNVIDTVSLVAVRTRPGWASRICDSSGVTISSVVVSASGGRRGIFTWIRSPSNAQANTVDTTAVRGTSRWSAAVRDSAILRTTITLSASIIVDPDRTGNVRPRDSTEYSLYVVNNGNATDSILLSTARTRPWARATVMDSLRRTISAVRLAPFGGRQNILVKINADSTAIAGWIDTTVLRGTSTNIPAIRDTAIVMTTVIPVTNIIVDPDHQSFVSRFDSTWYDHYVENRGNSRDSIPLFTSGTRPGWRAEIWDSARTRIINNVVLNPSQRRSIWLKIKPPTNAQYRWADTTYLRGYSTVGSARDSARDITEITLDASILVDPDQTASILPGDSVYYSLYVKNRGNALDTILLSRDVPPPGWTVEIQDTNGVGISRVVLGPLTDSVRIQAKVKSPGNAPIGFADTTFVKGASRNVASVADSARLITSIRGLARIIVEPDSAATVLPGDTVRYLMNVINQGNATDSVVITRTGTRPSWRAFIFDSAGTTPLTFVRLAPFGGRIKIMTKVVSPDTAAAGSRDTTQVIGNSTVVPGTADTARVITTIRTMARIIVDPDTAATTNPRQTVRYYLNVINQGNAGDSILLATTHTRPGWSALVYDSAGTNQLSFVRLSGLGGRIKIRVDITPPDTAQAPAGSRDTTYVRGTSTNVTGISDSAALTTTINQVFGLVVRPSQSGQTLPARPIDYNLRAINRGNGTDSVALTRYHTRTNWQAQLYDSTGTNVIDRVRLGSYNDSVRFILRVTPPVSVPPTEIDTTVVRGNSFAVPSVLDSAIINTLIGIEASIVLDPDSAATALPGDTVRYFVNVINGGNASDSVTLSRTSTVGWCVGVFDSSGTSPITYVRVPPNGARKTVMVKVRSPQNAPNGARDTTVLRGRSTNDTTKTDVATLTTIIGIQANIILDPDSVSTSLPGDTVRYYVNVINGGNASDSVTLSRTSTAGWCVGVFDSAGTAPISFVIVPPNNARRTVMVKVRPPQNAPSGARDTTVLRGRSTNDTTKTDIATLVTTVNVLARVLVTPNQQGSTRPGIPVSYFHTVQNLGPMRDSILLTTHGSRPLWNRQILDSLTGLPIPAVVLDPNQSRRVALRITPPGNAGMTEIDVSYLTGTSSNLTTIRDSAQDITQLGFISALNIESSQQAIVQSEASHLFHLSATLIGNIPDTVRLSTRNTKAGWTATLRDRDGINPIPSLHYLNPGEVFEFTLSVTAPRVSIIGRAAVDTTFNKDSTAILGNVIFRRSANDSLIFADSINLVTQVIPGLDIHNFSSPFRAAVGTRFIFSVPQAGEADLVVYNRLGEVIVRLLERRQVLPGIHIAPWNGSNEGGRPVAPGTYIYIFKFRPQGENTEEVVKKKTAIIP